jgi:hypothetical protein
MDRTNAMHKAAREFTDLCAVEAKFQDVLAREGEIRRVGFAVMLYEGIG